MLIFLFNIFYSLINLKKQVMRREGVSRSAPEGRLWVEVASPREVVGLGVGAGGRVWGVTWQGELQVFQGHYICIDLYFFF